MVFLWGCNYFIVREGGLYGRLGSKAEIEEEATFSSSNLCKISFSFTPETLYLSWQMINMPMFHAVALIMLMLTGVSPWLILDVEPRLLNLLSASQSLNRGREREEESNCIFWFFQAHNSILRWKHCSLQNLLQLQTLGSIDRTPGIHESNKKWKEKELLVSDWMRSTE